MFLTIDKILNERGKSIYWLAKTINSDYESVRRMVQNETNAISFNMIQKLCVELKVTPNDIFKIE